LKTAGTLSYRVRALPAREYGNVSVFTGPRPAGTGDGSTTSTSYDVPVIVCISPQSCEGIGTVTRDATRSNDASAAGMVSEPASPLPPRAAPKPAAETFPAALRLLPAPPRRHLTAVYGFARSADDMGDEAAPGDRLRLLGELEADLSRLYRPEPGER